MAMKAARGVDLRNGIDDALVYGRSLGRQDAGQGSDLTDPQLDGGFRFAGALCGEKSRRQQRADRDASWNLAWGPLRAEAQDQRQRLPGLQRQLAGSRGTGEVSRSIWMEARRDRCTARRSKAHGVLGEARQTVDGIPVEANHALDRAARSVASLHFQAFDVEIDQVRDAEERVVPPRATLFSHFSSPEWSSHDSRQTR